MHTARDFARGRILFFDSRGDGDGDTADLPDGVADAADRHNAIGGGGLNRIDLSGDLFGRLRGLTGEFLDLGCDDGKTPSGVTGSRRLDGRIECQQIGLAGDRADQLQHIADLFSGSGKAADHFRGLRGLDHGLVGNTAGKCDLSADFGHRRGKLLGRGGNRADTGRGLVGCVRRGGGPLRSAADAGGDLAGDALHVRCGLRNGADHALDVGLEAVGHLALQRSFLDFGLLFGDVLRFAQRAGLDHVAAEYVHGHRHGAEFVFSLATGNRHIDITAREPVHHRGNGRQRTR